MPTNTVTQSTSASPRVGDTRARSARMRCLRCERIRTVTYMAYRSGFIWEWRSSGTTNRREGWLCQECSSLAYRGGYLRAASS